MIALLIQPEGITHLFPLLASALWVYGGRICVAFVIIMLALMRKVRYDRNDVFLFLFLSASFVLTIIKGESIVPWITIYCNVVLILLLLLIYRDDLPTIIDCAQTYLELLIYINLICLFLYPNGMYYSMEGRYTQNWFLGYKSSFQYYIVPAMIFGWINYEYRGAKKRFIVLTVVCLIETILSGNAMLLVSLIILLALIIFRVQERTSLLNGRNYLVAAFAENVLMVFFTSILTSSSIGYAVLTALNKNLSLSGRASTIWPKAISYVQQHLLLGYGVLSSSKHVEMFGSTVAIHCHNQMLEILFTGGVILFTIYMLWHVLVFKHMYDNKSLKTSQILGLGCFIVLIMTSVEVFSRSPGCGIWLVLILAGRSRDVDRQMKSIDPESVRLIISAH